MNINELKLLQGLPLDLKIAKTKLRIRDAIMNFGIENLYLSFSGGKDSTVLHYLVKRVEMELYDEIRIPRVFCDTGLEYPELRKFVYDLKEELGEKLIIIKPEITFKNVLSKYGYPVISKEQSQFIHQYRTAKSEKTKLTRWNGNKWGRGKISEKWKPYVNSDFRISDKCCDVMKKKPFKKYEKETGKSPILGKMASESSKRTQDYIKQGGCNAFNNKRPKSEPIGFWTEQDVLKYIYHNNIKIAECYGDIDYSVDQDKYFTTKCDRTGCMFCMYGIHLEKEENRFERMKETHPKIYEYCLRGGEYDDEGMWVPKNGLGMKKILDDMNIRY